MIAWAPLRHGKFRWFWAAELGSRVGFWLQLVGQSWLVWRISASPLAVGVVAAIQLVPGLVLAPFGGLLADRLLCSALSTRRRGCL
ncbi:MAG: MFS transporter [Candidatus Dormibacteria bacterium]